MADHQAEGHLHSAPQLLRQPRIEAVPLLIEEAVLKPAQARQSRFDMAVGLFQMRVFVRW